jgi:hypothetical protein
MITRKMSFFNKDVAIDGDMLPAALSDVEYANQENP